MAFITKNPKVKRKRRTKEDDDYLSNKDFLPELIKCQQEGKVSEKLGEMFMILVNRYASQYNFRDYSYIDEMKQHALLACVNALHSFKPEKSSNPFSYYSQAVYTAFMQILNKEKRQRDIRDELLLEANMKPSSGYEDNSNSLFDSGQILSDDIDVDNMGFEMLESKDSIKNEEPDIEKDSNI